MDTRTATPVLDAAHFRRVLGHFPTGVAVITAVGDDGRPVGMAVGSFTSVSLDPPLVAFLPDRSSTTFPAIRAAGRFAVNFLTAEQEWICRAFASRGGDKFAGVDWAPAPVTGSPVVSGGLAWIDCTLETLHEAGDHFIVVGRVEALDAATDSLPLLFFQGGYGRFASLSLASSTHSGLLRELRHVDTARAEMEQLAGQFDVECLALVRQQDDLVVLASSSSSRDRRLPTRVGQRMPIVPPMGALLVAWDPLASRQWLDLAREGGGPREDLEAALARVRARGWSLGLASAAQWEFQELVGEIGPEGATPAQQRRLDAVSRAVLVTDSEPAHLTPGARHEVRSISAPVFGPDGRVVLMLALFGFRTMTTEQVHDQRDRLLRSAEVVSSALGGRPPADVVQSWRECSPG
jgi:flavin reductase (DIM6/NTAB) family NADH-FMN oxidoreductase RutF/DNA-binding IclR family transcriptional regulator